MVGTSTEVGDPTPPTAQGLGTLDYIKDLLAKSEPATGTLVERYLKSRGISIVPPVLRFAPSLRHAPSGRSFPAMVAPVVNVSGELIGCHRTFLEQDGSGKASVSPPRMMLGHCAGGAVRLAESDSRLAVAEGIESALSVLMVEGLPVWSALSTIGLAALELPSTVSVVTVYADSDEPGLVAARKAKSRWSARGLKVKILRPESPNKDFNDILEKEEA